MTSLLELDSAITVALNDFGPSWLDAAMLFLSKIWVWIPLYLAVAVVLCLRLGWKKGLAVVVAAALALVVTDQGTVLIKNLVCRLRPCEDPLLAGIISPLQGHGSLYGFPSSHACNTFCFAALTASALKGATFGKYYAAAIYLWAAAVTFSRIYVGKHFMGDCIAGAALGVATGLLFALIVSRIFAAAPSRKRQ